MNEGVKGDGGNRFELEIEPRFCETDGLGHINNTALPVWFEEARRPVFELFMDKPSFADWNLILRRIEVDFEGELFWGEPVTVRTGIGRVGNTSVAVEQEAWQKGRLCARGRAVLVHFDFAARRSLPIPDAVRERLADHAVAGGGDG